MVREDTTLVEIKFLPPVGMVTGNKNEIQFMKMIDKIGMSFDIKIIELWS